MKLKELIAEMDTVSWYNQDQERKNEVSSCDAEIDRQNEIIKNSKNKIKEKKEAKKKILNPSIYDIKKRYV